MLGAALIWIPRNEVFPISYFIYGQTIAYAVTLIVAFVLVLRLTSKEENPRALSTETVFSSSLPFALLIFFSMISGRIDAVLLERIKGSFDAGIYAMAYRLGDMLTMISYLFAVLLLPMFSRQLAAHSLPQELFSIAFRLLLTGCTAVAFVSVFESEYLLQLLYHEHTAEASLVLPWTIGAAVMFSLQYASGTLLTAGHKMKLMIVVAILSLVVNIILNMRLIPFNGAVGAAQAAFFTQAFVFVIQSVFIHHYYRVWTRKLLLRSAAFIIASILLASAIVALNLTHVLSLLCITGSILLLGIVTGTLPLGDLKKLIATPHAASEES
jgi:O-antigen/teichoic acid export membrane protein